jgi:hypothetical protein
MATDFRSAYVRVAGLFEAHFGLSERELRELVTAAQREWEELHTTYGVVLALGRKPC